MRENRRLGENAMGRVWDTLRRKGKGRGSGALNGGRRAAWEIWEECSRMRHAG